MRNSFLVDCVSKDHRLNPYERIQRIGGPKASDVPAPDASRFVTGLRNRGLALSERPRWSLSLVDAIRGVLDGEWSFFIYFGAHQEIVNVEVAKSPSGCLYLKTEMDNDTPDELLFLPECR
jgi:Protein of unknown function (DUF3892)